jgi:hypothetical protein
MELMMKPQKVTTKVLTKDKASSDRQNNSDGGLVFKISQKVAYKTER